MLFLSARIAGTGDATREVVLRGFYSRSLAGACTLRRIFALFAAVLAATPSAHAAFHTWIGTSGDTNMSNPANWQEGTVPANGDTIVLSSAGTSLIVNDLNVTLNSIQASFGLGFVVKGNPLVLSGAIPISNQTATSQLSIETDVTLTNANARIQAIGTNSPATSGLIALRAPVHFAGTLTLDADSRATIEVEAPLLESLPANLVLIGNGQINFDAGGSSISNSIVSSVSTLWIKDGTALGTSSSSFSVSDTSDLLIGNNSGPPTVLQRPLTILDSNATTLDLSVEYPSSIPVSVALQGDARMFLVADLAVSGAVSGAGGIYLSGNGKLTLTNTSNSFAGPVTVSAGLENGASEVIPDSSPLFVLAGGTYNVGPFTETVNTFSCAGTFKVVAPSGLVRGTNGAILSGCALQVSALAAPVQGTKITIVSSTLAPVTGQFNALAEGAPVSVGGVTTTISYHGGSTGNDVVLTVPSVAAASVTSSAPGVQPIAINQAMPSISVRAFDGSGNAIPGAQVYFSSNCALFNGLSVAVVTADSQGYASSPAGSTGPTPGGCQVTVAGSLGGTALRTFIVSVYDPAALAIAATPPTISVGANQPYQLQFRVTHTPDLALDGLGVSFTLDGQTASASPLSVPAPLAAQFGGFVTPSLTANGYNGTYTITAHAGHATGQTLVTQTGGIAPGASFTSALMDMWWGGSSQNGWGMSLVQHGDTLFGALYIYDANGKPMWLVLPGGTWNPTHTAYSGSIYTPTGSPFFAYDATRLSVGLARGTATITFTDATNASIDYTIDGVVGHKLLTREIFASGALVQPVRTDLWWGGSPQNGWGVTILQQASTLFSVWYTYDEHGVATWYVMPGGSWTASDTYEGHIYRTLGSQWIGADYDPSKLQVSDVGTYKLQFNGDSSATFTYDADGHSGSIPLVKEPF
jgi:autotransporter-associated beta strand protein